jgi:hypothetical protein
MRRLPVLLHELLQLIVRLELPAHLLAAQRTVTVRVDPSEEIAQPFLHIRILGRPLRPVNSRDITGSENTLEN